MSEKTREAAAFEAYAASEEAQQFVAGLHRRDLAYEDHMRALRLCWLSSRRQALEEGPLANTPKNRLIRSAIAQIEEQNLSKWSDDHDRVTLNALREYLSVWGDREGVVPK